LNALFNTPIIDNRRVFLLLKYALLILASIPFVFPFWWMFTTSLKPISDVFGQLSLLPDSWLFSNYLEVFRFQPFAQHYFNSVYIATLVTILTLIVASLAGYGFARIRFRGNSLFFLLLLTSLMMPIEVTIIPNFYLMQGLGWTDTHLPLIVLPVLGPQGIVATFMMRQFFLSFPSELEDAARIDGLGRLGILWRVALPISRPILGTVAILTFLYSWNSFLEPLIYLSDQRLFTIPLSLRSYTDSYGFPLWNIQLAATVLSVVPMLIVFIVAQKQIVDSFARSGLKG
jgi:multiple sugar transport system permease protein